jgi:hypothetical protein
LAREEVVCLLVRNDVEDGELVSDCEEETMAVWGYLFGAWDIGERGVETSEEQWYVSWSGW